MNKQLSAIARFMSEDSFSLTDVPNVATIGSLKYTLSTLKSSHYFFKMPPKLKHPMRQNLNDSIQKAVDSLSNLFTIPNDKFLSYFTVSYFILVDENDVVSMQASFKSKANQKYPLTIPLFDKSHLHNLDFVIDCSLTDYMLTERQYGYQLKNLRHLYLLSNFKHDIRQLLGTLDDIEITSDLLDMYFI